MVYVICAAIIMMTTAVFMAVTMDRINALTKRSMKLEEENESLHVHVSELDDILMVHAEDIEELKRDQKPAPVEFRPEAPSVSDMEEDGDIERLPPAEVLEAAEKHDIGLYARKLIACRKARMLTQAEVARALHMNRSTVAKWEQGRAVPNEKRRIQLSKVYDVDPARLAP